LSGNRKIIIFLIVIKE